MIFRNDKPAKKSTERLTGRVKFFKHSDFDGDGRGTRGRGYGFVTGDDGSEFFFHYTELQFHASECKRGTRVTFEITATSRGDAAIEVQKIEDDEDKI